jgi:hypothetical protein
MMTQKSILRKIRKNLQGKKVKGGEAGILGWMTLKGTDFVSDYRLNTYHHVSECPEDGQCNQCLDGKQYHVRRDGGRLAFPLEEIVISNPGAFSSLFDLKADEFKATFDGKEIPTGPYGAYR